MGSGQQPKYILLVYHSGSLLGKQCLTGLANASYSKEQEIMRACYLNEKEHCGPMSLRIVTCSNIDMHFCFDNFDLLDETLSG